MREEEIHFFKYRYNVFESISNKPTDHCIGVTKIDAKVLSIETWWPSEHWRQTGCLFIHLFSDVSFFSYLSFLLILKKEKNVYLCLTFFSLVIASPLNLPIYMSISFWFCLSLFLFVYMSLTLSFLMKGK